MENGPDTATGLYDVKRLAKRMGVKTSTIRSMKARGTIPAPTCNDIKVVQFGQQILLTSF